MPTINLRFMHVHINHCWCNNSNWTGEHYYARYMVCMSRVPKGKTYYDPADPDWLALLHEVKVKSTTWNNRAMRLNPDVMQWLHDNVKDFKGMNDEPHGWCVGNDDYNSRDTLNFTIWFQRRSDAMNFVKTWSVFKKPTSYLNYFTENRRELVNGKLVKVKS